MAAEAVFTTQVEESCLTGSTGPSLRVLLTVAVPSRDGVSYSPLGTVPIIQHSSWVAITCCRKAKQNLLGKVSKGFNIMKQATPVTKCNEYGSGKHYSLNSYHHVVWHKVV